ncbi:tRNA-binding EMAP/Myf domain (EMAP) (PDB:1MKH) [Commensalibacter communis]|uniref:tRNA-binding EMAP/Myf domain (EMAP) n=1 Tax=Commensalibacter communis TaxID=2972786 RepID=A0A9W4X699_9PROT|nr:hypothetical protein [Commensalibacter communis]CAI3925467.1 tRNA-binding EMAP/Myf domain (EMAP) (PDB:1MKH) [Commensalibacter communis]CAI3926004.1 tRNA-binding EMAP/Myf domain (EMAP) (PDB:1MKH) [Commensalibacter communis]CAI3935344.1 tRNA-binding EMAP/Myf domain (EMAP) (PDB:1MKH) [Commensalibacter communis]CAI3937012.1 tRNA-binding EMAP/Myf domain (EMAP) (PDB:1MKH) [Commensalibacter communis]CAI3937035.1 tRNA-binding EMAP/Myf domain (EMAP) (PDB:1MKH) [Commensalibacter communis]
MATVSSSFSFDIRAGTIIQAVIVSSPGHYILKVNFGSIIGIRNCILHTAPHIHAESLLEQHVCAIINFPEFKKNIKTLKTILLCMPDIHGYYIPIQPDHCIPNGGSLFL